MTAVPAPCENTFLSPGQCLFQAVDAGTVLMAAAGRLHIEEAPQWLAQRCVRASRTLEAGEHHVVAQAGWIAITALGPGAQGACLRQWLPARAAARRPVWRFMRRLVGI
ncbi:hypothetical protein [Xenophilus sp. Marseille-Q4582]|uniref:hypothetical protein n=1 Tax=Xenophilus sp. Marseille-Q4582 TaxID=2866600 RepID=UPI001CE3F9F6|nr:hypothetical protein [Xenophilus sp. Marseille-Q4582]